jgi:hypothetical protein
LPAALGRVRRRARRAQERTARSPGCAALHPDHERNPARKRLLDRALQIFNGLAIVEIDPD